MIISKLKTSYFIVSIVVLIGTLVGYLYFFDFLLSSKISLLDLSFLCLLILFLVYVIVLVIVNKSRFEITVTRDYLLREIAYPMPFGIFYSKKKYYLRHLDAVIMKKIYGTPVTAFHLFFENGKVSMGSSLTKTDEVLMLFHKFAGSKFSKEAQEYINELNS